jgi:hypothetical protein
MASVSSGNVWLAGPRSMTGGGGAFFSPEPITYDKKITLSSSYKETLITDIFTLLKDV